MLKLYRLLLFFVISFSTLCAQGSYTELNLKGKEALKLKNQEAAEKYFYQSIMQNKDTDSHFQLAKLYLRRRDSKLRNLGYDYISQAILNEPENLEIKYLYLDYLEWFGKRSKRLEEYRKIFANYPNQAMAIFKIAEIMFFEYEKYRAYEVDTERWFLDEDVIPFDMTPLVQAELDSAETYYLHGIKIDSTNHYGLFGITKMYQTTTKPEKAIDYLKKILKYYPEDKEAHLELGVYYYKKKKLDESFKEFQKAMTLMSGEEKEDFVYNSVIKLLEPKYLDSFQKMSVEEKRNLISKWWLALDPLYLSPYNERLMEHYARVAYANLFFSVPNIDVIGWKSDRGQVLIRYGEPVRKEKFRQNHNLGSDLKGIGLTKSKIMSESALMDPNALRFGSTPEVINPMGIPNTFIEIWEYDNIPGFCFTGDVNYYKFVTGNEMEELIRKKWAPRSTGGIPSMLDSRSAINSLRDYESVKRQKVQGYTPVLYGNKLNIEFRTYVFNKLTGNNNGNVDVYAAYVIPTKDSTNKNIIKDLTHEIGVFFFDQNFDPIIQVRDTIRGTEIKNNYPDGSSELVNCIGFGLTPRKISFAFDLRRMVDSNYFTYRKTIDLPKFGINTLGLSDLVFTNNIELEKGLPFGIKRGEISFYPKLSNKFNNGEQFYIYYEVYNLKMDDKKEGEYEQVITIKPKGKDDTILKKIVKGITTIFTGDEGKVSLTANYRTKEENTQVYMQLDLTGYKPGRYELIVTINDRISGNNTEKKIDLEIM